MNRPYTQTARAQAAEETGERILGAALNAFLTEFYDAVTLDKIAADAGVTVRTVIRRFGSKEGLLNALESVGAAAVRSQRGEAPVGDIAGIAQNLVEHYEDEGELAMHILRQEHTVAAIADISASGKRLHADWCNRVFAPWLDAHTGVERERLRATVIAICDVYTWYLLRRQQGLSRRQTKLAFIDMLNGVLS